MAAHNEEDNMNGPASPIPFQFTEDMKGYVTFAQTNYQDGFDQGKRDGNFLMFHLTLKTGDLDRFLTVKEHEADAIGYVECALLGGRCPVERGWFNLFVETADPDRRVMTYRLFFRDVRRCHRLSLRMAEPLPSALTARGIAQPEFFQECLTHRA